MPKEQKYEAAMRQLEDIAAKMENAKADKAMQGQTHENRRGHTQDSRRRKLTTQSATVFFVLIISNLRQIVAGLFYYYYFCLRLGEHIPAMKKKRIKT